MLPAAPSRDALPMIIMTVPLFTYTVNCATQASLIEFAKVVLGPAAAEDQH